MADGIDQIAARIGKLIVDNKLDFTARLGIADAVDGPNAERTLSNATLLLEALVAFYGDPKSDFFPAAISAGIRDRLVQIDSTIAGFPPADQPILPDTALGLLKILEDLYVYCLQYGLISFGFSGKMAQDQIELIRGAQQLTKVAADEMLASVAAREQTLTRKLEEFEQAVAKAENDFKAAVTAQLETLQPSIDSLSALVEGGKSQAEAITEHLKLATDNVNAVQTLRTDLDLAAAALTAEFDSQRTAATTELETIQALSKQVRANESDVKARGEAVSDARAKIQVQLDQITAFYGEIEANRLQMTETGKATQSQFADLVEKTDKLVAGFSERTATVVQTNEALVEQIKDHLRKAIGVSLFTAFNTRRKAISVVSWIWAALLLGSVGGTIWFAIWFVQHLAELAKEDVHPILLYARLVLVAPLAFLIAFTAKRYTSERRAEEEYAFKSAISVSLEPFRDLIARMKKEALDTAFVESLILEIFDNPTKRLYGKPSKDSKEVSIDVLDLVKEMLEKLPNTR